MRGSPAAFESFLAEAREDTAKADGLRLRRRAKPLSLFPRKKRKGFFDGVKRKRLGSGIPGSARNARSACYGGFGPVVIVGVNFYVCPCRQQNSRSRPDAPPSCFAAAPWRSRGIGGRGAPGCILLLFCCRSPVAAEDRQRRAPNYPQQPRCGSEKRS